MPTMQQPEVYIANSNNLFDENLVPTNKGTEEFLEGVGKQFSDFALKFI